jgi:hypothetical protein
MPRMFVKNVGPTRFPLVAVLFPPATSSPVTYKSAVHPVADSERGIVSGQVYRDTWSSAGRRGRITPTLGSRPAGLLPAVFICASAPATRPATSNRPRRPGASPIPPTVANRQWPVADQ